MQPDEGRTGLKETQLKLKPERVRERGRRMENPNEEEGEEQDGLSVHSAGQAPPSSASSLPKEHSQVELELRVLEALEIYPLSKLQGIHRHFVLYGLMEFLKRCFDRPFSSDEVLQLLDRFFNLELLKPEDDEMEALNQEDDFCLPHNFIIKEET